MTRKRALLTVFACVATIVVPAKAAFAGTYDVYSCRQPDGSNAGLGGWSSVGSSAGFLFDHCSSGGSFGAGLGTGAASEFASSRWIFDAPAATTISGFALYRSATSVGGAGWSKGYGLYLDSVDYADGHLAEQCFAWGGCAALGKPGGGIAATNYFAMSGLSRHRLIAVIDCFGENRGCPSTQSSSRVDIYQARIRLSDPTAPAFVKDPSGSLFSSAPVSGLERVSVGGVDAGGGLYRVGVEVDGKVYGSQPVTSSSTCRRPATVPVPCPLEASGTYSFDTREFPDGTHTVRIALSDVAGNTTYSEPRTVTIRNHERPNGINASRDVLLSARFNRHGRYRLVRYGGRPVVVGRLRRKDGTPIIGAQLAVLGRSKRPGSPYRLLRTPTTTRTGRFHVKLPKGPSRYLRVGYRAYDLDSTAAAQRRLSLDVHAGVRLTIHPRTVRNGHAIVFRGRLLGGPGRRGTLVTMQETTPRPLTFMTLHADRHGRFHATYRFRYTYRLARFRFRALVQHQAGYPYAAGRSRRLSVVVLP